MVEVATARGKGRGKRMLILSDEGQADEKEENWIEEEEDVHLPEATETVVEDLMVGLGDKVRKTRSTGACPKVFLSHELETPRSTGDHRSLVIS